MKLQKTTINHIIVISLFIIGLCCAVYGASIIFGLVLPYADKPAVYLAQLMVGVVWILAWIFHGLYRQNRDLSINDMGPIALKTYIGEITQVYENKYGEQTEGK